MKNKTIEILALILGLLTTVAGILTLPQVAMLPKEWQPFVGLALALVVVGKNGAYVILDFCDDGQLNKSYKIPDGVKVALLCGLLLCLTSCANNGKGVVTFAGLTRSQWELVMKESGSAAVKAGLQTGVSSYGARRLETAAKAPIDVQP